MADTPIDSTEMLRVMKSAGWATEASLSRLVGLSANSEKLLTRLAERFKVNTDDIGRMRAATEQHSDISQQGFAQVAKGNAQGLSSVRSAITGLGSSFGKALSMNLDNPAGPFAAAGDSMKKFSYHTERTSPALSVFANGLGTAAAVTALLVTQLYSINTTMKDMFASGVIVTGGFKSLADSATSAGISAQEFSTILTKNAGVTVALGTQRTMKLMGMFSEATKNGSEFVMSNKESQEAFADTMALMQNAGTLRNATDGQVVNQSREYLGQLNKLSEATGRNRDEIRKAQLAMSQMPQVFVAMRRLPESLRGNFQKVQASIAASFGEEGPRMMDEMAKFMTGGVGSMSKEFQLLFSNVGGGIGEAMQNMATAIQNGSDAEEERAALVERIQNLDQSQLDAMALAAKNNPEMAAVLDRVVKLQHLTRVESERAAKDAAMSDQEKKDREQAIKETQDRQAAFNRLTASLAGLQNSLMSTIATLEPILIPAIEGVASTIKFLGESLVWLVDKVKGVATMFGAGEKTSSIVAIAVVATAAVLGASIIRSKMTQLLSGVAGKLMGSSPAGGAAGGAGQAVGRGAASAGQGIGSGVSNAMKGLGAGLRGVAGGLAALANPATLVGLAAVTAAIIGIGYALSLAAPALEPFGKMIHEIFSGLGDIIKGAGEAISSVITGIGDGVASTAQAISTIITGLSDGVKAIITGIGSVIESAGTAISSVIKGIGDGIKSVFEGVGTIVNAAGDSIVKVVDSLTKLRTEGTRVATDQIERLSRIPGANMLEAAKGIDAIKLALDGFAPGMFSGFSQMIGSVFSTDNAATIEKLGAAGKTLVEGASGINMFSTEMSKLFGILDETNLGRLLQMGKVLSSMRDIFTVGVSTSRITPMITAVTSMVKGIQEATPSAGTPGAVTITTDQLNQRTLRYYDDSLQRFIQMAELLEKSTILLERLDNNADSRSRDVVNAIETSGGRIR